MDTELNTPGMEEVEYLAALLLKQLRHEITETELQYLENWKASHPSHALVSEQVNDSEQLLNDLLAMKQVDLEGRWQQISAQINPAKMPAPLYRRWYAWAAAALVLFIAGAITWPYLASKKTLPPVVENKENKGDDFNIPPGGNRAMLTLSNGSVINLDNAANGQVAKEGNENVVKLKDGELKYQSVPAQPGANGQLPIVYNTLATPRGGQYQLLLPDGSKVWLNAASSIKYPTHFSEKERRVAITGEVYFDVSPLPASPPAGGGGGGKNSIPFVVDVLPPTGQGIDAEVEVMGTQFNIMAYNDEKAITTTLVNGKVKVSVPASTPGNNPFKLLAAGQQAQIPQPIKGAVTSDLIKVMKVEDMDDALAWKNGLISLNNSGIKEIMRTLSRWYNIEVNYPGKVPNYKFSGTIPRSENLSTVIKILENNGVHFRLQKNVISVLP
jgi:ferric-dicitrate binding protein FerR (iron transport regulator)